MRYCVVHYEPGCAEPWDWVAYEVMPDTAVPRMIEHCRDGRVEGRSIVEEGGVSLVHGDFEIETPDDEFTTTEIGADEFERRWQSARMGSPA